ncbi:RcnB family protein [Glaciimonas sp. PCH181]|uniref:RcnB family protein n=1 Tax=Glaciimonas sp. PCH181 TaxID=2133943 RepID=UPI000D367918|nr:RcnB family protein [Glaciimonas sp. PCH181]PUA18857.1 hypothetical protein C7W93_02775 [Glaciimonas sp. PCH181]
MNRKIVLSTIMAISLSTGGAAFGQDNEMRTDRGHDQGRNQQMQRGGDQQDHRGNGGRPMDRGGFQNRGNNNQVRQDERGAGPNHDFRRGGRLPPEYRNNRQYVVDDWRGHHLSAPPRGYHWVQTGGDYVLAAIGTGIILQLLLNN